VEGCDIASPFRDFMTESLRETNEKVKQEMEKTMNALQVEMTAIKQSQQETEKENEMLRAKLLDSEKYIASLKEDMEQVQKATWDNRNFRIEMEEKLSTVESHLEKTAGFDVKASEKKKPPFPNTPPSTIPRQNRPNSNFSDSISAHPAAHARNKIGP